MRRFFYSFYLVLTWLLAIAYFVASLTPVLSPEFAGILAFIELGFPYLLVALIFFIVCWLFIKKKIAFYLLLLMLVGYQNIAVTFAFNITGSHAKDTAHSIRILSWNVRNFDNAAYHADSATSVRRLMFNHIQKTNPDILCLQEMAEYEGPSYLSNINQLKDLGYIYYYKPKEIDNKESYYNLLSGSAIFSKIPLIDSGAVVTSDTSFPEKLVYADINFKGKKLRIITTHYRSMYLFPKGVFNPIPLHGDTTIIHKASNIEKVQVFAKEHALQSRSARKLIEASPYPVIFTGDLNTVPTSYAYHTTRQDLQDAFLEKGTGLGGSLDSFPKTLRIDYIFADKQLEVLNYRQHKLSLSDHYPHYVDISWKR